MEILVYVLLAFCLWGYGVVCGWKAREKHALQLTQKLLDGLEEKEKEESNDKIFISIEKHNGVIYVYDKTTKTFMAQGNNKEELENILRERFPGKTFAASQEDLENAGLLS
jgi:hypothetical protein